MSNLTDMSNSTISDSMMSLNGNTMTASMLSLNSISSATLRDPDRSRIEFDRKEFVFCLTRKSMVNNRQLMEAIKFLNPEYTIADTEDQLLIYAEERRKYFFVCDIFSGEIFSLLRKRSCRICGPPLLIYIHTRNRSLPNTHRPTFNSSMFGVAVCFTGFGFAERKETVGELADLVHFMGGSVRKDFSGKITHVVAFTAQGQKYKAAVNLGKHIMTEKWVTEAWEKRLEMNFKANKPPFVDQFQMKPFEGLKLSFLGFPPEETEHMQETTINNGGRYFPVGTVGCTHLVVEDEYQSDLPSEVLQAVHVVKQEWFWRSIQLDACAEESLYFFTTDQGTPLGIGTRVRKKRKILNASDISDLLSPNSPYHNNKRRSKDRLSAISTTFDSSLGTSITSSLLDSPEVVVKPNLRKPLTARNQTCLELQQTERNYVDVLNTIVKIFKEPLEQSGEQRGGALLAPEEIKTIFGTLPDLLEVHEQLLKSLDVLVNDWNEEQLIGKTIVDCADGMIKAYPTFVNYFDMIKETIARCDKERPRFHAFLKICLNNPDCGRQSLTELLIRPVQRLPSMCLLLNDILKHTPEANPDHKYLKEAVEAVKKVLTYINEDKRKTEHQFQMFEIIGAIDNCPPYILSAHRTLVSKAEVQEVSEGRAIKCDVIQMFLFNDSIEIAKRRHRVNMSQASTKSPALTHQRGGQMRPYKHIEFIKLSLLKSVVDIKDEGEFRDMFGLIYYSNAVNKDTLTVYKLIGGATKDQWITNIVKCLSETKCTADSENYLVSVDLCDVYAENEMTQNKEKTTYLGKIIGKTKAGLSKRIVRAMTSVSKTPKMQLQTNTTLRRAVSVTTTPGCLEGDTPMTPCTPLSPSVSEYSVMDVSVCDETQRQNLHTTK